MSSSKKKQKKEKKKVERSIAKILNKNQLVRKFLTGLSAYEATLLDPFNVHAVKIPDFNTTPSFPVTVVQRYNLTVNAQGVTGIALGIFCPPTITTSNIAGLIPLLNSGTVAYRAIGCTPASSATSSTVFSTASTGIGLTCFPPAGTTPTQDIGSIATHVRLASLGLSIVYTGTPLDAKGSIAIASVQRQYAEDVLNFPVVNQIGADDIMAMPGSSVVPVNHLEGASAVYKPQDFTQHVYVELAKSYGGGNTGTVTTGPSDYGIDISQLGQLYIACTGCTADATFVATLVANYECLPKLNTMNIVNVAPSPADPRSMSRAATTVAAAPTTMPFAVTSENSSSTVSGAGVHTMSATASSSPAESQLTSVLAGDTGIVEKIGNVMDTGKKIYNSVSPFLDKVLPMAEEALAAFL